MLGQFNLLPLLKGWEYKDHTLTRTVARGQRYELPISEMGWLLNILMVTDDAYGTVGIQYQGSDLELHYYEWYPELGNILGLFLSDAGGYVQKYFRPNPYSTAGIYVVLITGSGFYGSAWPYVPTIKVITKLAETSTQTEATVSVTASTMAITDKAAFLKSLRLALQSKADLGIDLGLLTVGPSELGKAEKKGSS